MNIACEMKELYPDTWAFEDQGVRVFLLAGEERALVIDTGMTGRDLHSMISRYTDLPYKLLVTHTDGDHMSGIDQFPEFYMHPSEAFIYHNTKSGTGKMMPVFEGDEIDLGGRVLEIIHLPGHTPGSITVLDRGNRCLIGGDPIQVDGEIFMFGPYRDMAAYIASLERLEKRQDFDVIFPSHAVEKVDRDVIPQLIEGAKKVIAGEIAGEEKEMFGFRVRSLDVGAARFLLEANDQQ